MSPRALATVIALLLATNAAAGTMQARFQEANGHYYEKRFEQAREAYTDLTERYQLNNAVLFYNLGNAHFMLGELGRAILSYKRALEASPDEGLERRLRDNLDRCVEALIDRHRKDVGSVTVLDETHGVAYSLFHLLSADAAAIVLTVFWMLFFGALIARRLARGEALRRGLRTAAWSVAVPLVLAMLLFTGNVLTTRSVERGIVVENNVQMRDGRHPNAPASDVPEGLEVQVVDATDPTETRIRLSNGKEGWVPTGAVEPI